MSEEIHLVWRSGVVFFSMRGEIDLLSLFVFLKLIF